MEICTQKENPAGVRGIIGEVVKHLQALKQCFITSPFCQDFALAVILAGVLYV